MASRSKISDSELAGMFHSVQRTMNDRHSSRYRRIWVQYVRIGKERVDIVITLFPIKGDYRMVFFRDLNVDTISLESVLGLID